MLQKGRSTKERNNNVQHFLPEKKTAYSHHEHSDLGILSLRLSPAYAETGRNETSVFGLKPAAFINGVNLSLISSKRLFAQMTVWSSILLMATTTFDTPAVLTNMMCSRVWPPRSKPVSNSPLRAEITRMATSA